MYLLFITLFMVYFVACNCKYAFITWGEKDAEITLTDYFADIPEDNVARASYVNNINVSGWAYLEIHACKSCKDEKQAFAAGYLEGYLTRDLIWMHWRNMIEGYCYNRTDVCAMVENYLDKNEEYVIDMVRKMADEDAYWYQVKLFYIQMEGLTAGFNEATQNPYEKLTLRDIFWINIVGDLEELGIALTMPHESKEGLLFGADHCTGIVKLLPDYSDLYTSHVTWNSYQSMLRLQKMYVLNYRISAKVDHRIPGRKMSLSSYPAFVQSTDDFYVVSSGMVVSETTIGNSNRTLFEKVKPVGAILEFIRAMIANRMAENGKQWTEIFRKHNSGTYNNQWYVVDYKKFKPRTEYQPGCLENGTLWVVEQLPGYTEAADLTDMLRKETYFPSYNIAFFPTIFNMSGGWERVRIFGDWFGYETSPRAYIIRDLQKNITNIREMYMVLRYNDYKHDPHARTGVAYPPYNAASAIAGRFDLNPENGTYPLAGLGYRSHGATDCKLTNAYLAKSYQFIAISSPPHNLSRGIPPFQWSEFGLGKRILHVGHPDLWVFPPVLHQWEWE